MTERMHVFQGMTVGNHVEIIFSLNMKTFRLSVFPFRRETPVVPRFFHTCNKIVQLVLRGAESEWRDEPQQIRDILLATPKLELLGICHGVPEAPRLYYVQSYFCHGPRSCELQPGEGGRPVLRLTSNMAGSNSHALDGEDQHFASLHVTRELCNIPASEVFVASTKIISSSRICGEIHRMDSTSNHCIATRNASVRGARRWACPELGQLIIREALQAACAANPFEGCHIRVPELLAYIYDDDLECDRTVRRSRIMGGLYKNIHGAPLSEVLDGAHQGDPKLSILDGSISRMMESLHRLGFVWGGEYNSGGEATTLADCIVVDNHGFVWLVDGFGAAYEEEVVHSDCQALISLLRQVRVDCT